MKTVNQIEKELWLLLAELDQVANNTINKDLKFRIIVYLSGFKREVKNLFSNIKSDTKKFQ